MYKDLTLNLGFGNVKFVTLSQFIKLVAVRFWPENRSEIYYVQRHPQIPITSNTPDHYLTYGSSWRTIPCDLSKTPFSPKDILKDLPIEPAFKSNLLHMAENLICQSIVNMGNPTHLVRVSPRVWVAANPNDFEIHKSEYGMAFANHHPTRSVAWRVLYSQPNKCGLCLPDKPCNFERCPNNEKA